MKHNTLNHSDFKGYQIVFNEHRDFGHVHPFLTEEFLREFYRETYRLVRHESATSQYLRDKRKRALIQKAVIESHLNISTDSSVLDIGCGAGLLLEAFQTHKDIRLTGYEGDVAMAEVARDILPSAEIKAENFDVTREPTLQFDLVLLSHVFEHIPQPDLFLRKLRRWMNPNASLFIEVPNDPFPVVKLQCQAQVKGLAHVNFFTSRSLQLCLEKAGFRAVEISTWGDNIEDYWKARLGKSSLWSRATSKIGLLKIKNKGRFSTTPDFKSLKPGKGMYIRALARLSN